MSLSEEHNAWVISHQYLALIPLVSIRDPATQFSLPLNKINSNTTLSFILSSQQSYQYQRATGN